MDAVNAFLGSIGVERGGAHSDSRNRKCLYSLLIPMAPPFITKHVTMNSAITVFIMVQVLFLHQGRRQAHCPAHLPLSTTSPPTAEHLLLQFTMLRRSKSRIRVAVTIPFKLQSTSKPVHVQLAPTSHPSRRFTGTSDLCCRRRIVFSHFGWAGPSLIYQFLSFTRRRFHSLSDITLSTAAPPSLSRSANRARTRFGQTLRTLRRRALVRGLTKQ
jgi:hypothetical protein